MTSSIAPRARLRSAARVLLLPYLIALGLIVWLPGQDAEAVTGIVATLAQVLDGWGLAFEVGYPVLEFTANIALFVPFGVLVALAWPTLPAWAVIAAGGATSILIETVQLALPTRFSTVSDVVANTLGAAVGCLAVAWLGRRRAGAPAA